MSEYCDTKKVNYNYNFYAPFLALNYSSDALKPQRKAHKSHYTQGCKWSPDGSQFMVCTNDKRIKIFDLAPNIEAGEFNDETWMMGGWKKYVKPLYDIKQLDSIYDYQWMPGVESKDFFAVTCKSLPISLWNVQNDKSFGSYLHFNHLDELVAAYSIGFSPNKSYLVAGYSKSIQVFNVDKPGKLSSKIETKDNQGIVSSIAFHPVLHNVFAAGNYENNIGLYSLKTMKLFAVFKGHHKGVTHIKFSDDGTKLFSGTRKDNEILCWDIRNPGIVLASYKRRMTTAQRMYFDLTPNGNQYLLSGTTEGDVLVWDLSASTSGEDILPSASFSAHDDCVNGISLHPYKPLLATSCGRRHPSQKKGSSSSEEESEEECEVSECSVKLWWIGDA